MVAGDLDPGAASAWEGLTLVATEADERTQGKRGDAEPPDLIDLRLEAGHVDRSPDLTTVTVTAHIVDELSGVSHGNGSSPSQARLSSPSGQFRDVMFIPTTRVSGDDHHGTYSQAVELGEHAERGRSSLLYVMVIDNAGNRRDYQPGDLTAAGFATSVLVS